MSDWQPIETAPKDGTVILLYRFTDPVKLGFPIYTRFQAWDYAVGYYTSDKERAPTGWVSPPIANPTHWMPLPEPPK